MTDESEDSDSNTPLVKLRGGRRSRASKEPSPVENGVSAKRGRKSKEESNKSTRKSKASLTNGHIVEEKPNKKRNGRVESSLHFEELDQLLHDIMKHKDCWPFYEPVSTEDVPDYLNVIETPMDFTTMRNKLEDRVYSTDEELLADAALVLTNCYTYNKDTHPVAK
ncbi:hypothetical protein O0L34_g13038 [Tuta absoluta]|nr:hypothetical protein O0L34_g13038 [Tuta absoluta]